MQCITCVFQRFVAPFRLELFAESTLIQPGAAKSANMCCVTEVDFSEANARSRFQFSGSPPWISLPAESRVVCLGGKWKPSQSQAPHPQSLQNEDGLLRLNQGIQGYLKDCILRILNGPAMVSTPICCWYLLRCFVNCYFTLSKCSPCRASCCTRAPLWGSKLARSKMSKAPFTHGEKSSVQELPQIITKNHKASERIIHDHK